MALWERIQGVLNLFNSLYCFFLKNVIRNTQVLFNDLFAAFSNLKVFIDWVLYQLVFELNLVLEDIKEISLAQLVTCGLVHSPCRSIPLLIAQNVNVSKMWSIPEHGEWHLVLGIQLDFSQVYEIHVVSILLVVINNVVLWKMHFNHDPQQTTDNIVVIDFFEEIKFVHQFAVVHE